jgi:integrase
MTLMQLKGFKFFKDRHGHQRCYHRASATPIDLKKFPLGTMEFMAECARIAALGKAATPKPGTLGLLIDGYRKHEAFQNLSPRTRRDYDRCFDYLRPIQDTMLTEFDPHLVVGIRDKAGTALGRKWGNYIRTCLSIAFSWGRERGYIETNPASRIKGLRKHKDAPEANRPWWDNEREAVLNAASDHFIGPLALMMFCGLDPSDVATLPKRAVTDTHMDTKRGKTGEPVWFALPADAREALVRVPKHDGDNMFIAPDGKPLTYWKLDRLWRPIRARLEKEKLVEPGLTLKGLRHTVATILSEMGMDERTIADYLGQKTIEMARHYSRRADKRKKLNAVVHDFDKEVKRRAKKS